MALLARCCTLVIAALLAAGCSTNARTSLETSWIDPKLEGAKFKKVLILSLASDEFAQEYFQQDMAAALRQRGMNAVASERYFTNQTPSEVARFKRAVDQSGADAILIAHVVGVDEKAITTPGTLVAPNGTPYAATFGLENVVASTFAPTRYVRPSDYTLKTVMVEVLLYEMKGRKPVWSARTQTKNADQGGRKPAVAQFVSVIVNAMDRDGLF